MKRIAVIGAGGYSGAELVELLVGHPGTEVVGLFGSARRDGQGGPSSYAKVFPRFRGVMDLPLRATSPDAVLAVNPDAVFLATPHEVSMELAGDLLARAPHSMVVLDLSAAFRFKDAGVYPEFYGGAHSHPELLSRAVYGLPEINRAAIRGADLIGVPGCYPTSAILALKPLVDAGAILAREKGGGGGGRVIIDSCSGVSGAGRQLTQKSLFCEVSYQPYGVFAHRHQPEIEAYAGTPVVFTPHLGCWDRGIVSTMHVELAEGFDEARVREVMARAYADEPFVRLCEKGEWPSVLDVKRTNFCDIGLAAKDGHLILVSAIDNLTKGAAGQAVQCMNIRLGMDETAGLLGSNGVGSSARDMRSGS
jgi:N-acetyl-gamma-glutamyl-phosphate reductase